MSPNNNNNNTTTLLSTLIQLLSSTTNNGNDNNVCQTNEIPYYYSDEYVITIAAQALTESIMVVSDHCSTTRTVAASTLWNSITQQTNFILFPLQIASQKEWHDACHALATLLSTFVTEQIDDLIAHPPSRGVQLLLDIQSHPHTPVAIVPLECWLVIQETSMDDRHDGWKKPLYRKLVTILVQRMVYPQSFTNWEDEVHVDSSEFFEFRRMVVDVLISCYFLLRVEMVQMLIYQIRTATHWTQSESALYALTQISKDVCARCKSPAADGTLVARDRQATCHELLQLLEQLVTNVAMNTSTTQSQQQHPLLLAAVINFCGSYSPAWHSMDCPPQAILQLLSYLQSAFGILPIDAAKANRAIYITCLAKSMSSIEDITTATATNTATSGNVDQTILPLVLKSIHDSMNAVLQTTEEEAMTTVAEGATRLVTKLTDPNIARQALTSDLIQPVLERINASIQVLPESNNLDKWAVPQVEEATESLSRYLSVLQVMARFCDSPHIPAMGEWFLQQIGPCLEVVQRRTCSTPAQPLVLPKWITIHQQILRNTLPQEGSMVAMFSTTIPLVVQALEQAQHPATLKYISTAVENFGGKSLEMDKSFQDLLTHVTTVVTSQNNLAEATELLQAYFDCLQRYILYCPRAICYNPSLPTIVMFGSRIHFCHSSQGINKSCLDVLVTALWMEFLTFTTTHSPSYAGSMECSLVDLERPSSPKWAESYWLLFRWFGWRVSNVVASILRLLVCYRPGRRVESIRQPSQSCRPSCFCPERKTPAALVIFRNDRHTILS